MQKLIFATNNQYKVEEIKATLSCDFEIISLKDAGIDVEIEEPYDTLEENAFAKSSAIFKQTNIDCFSEDTGLEVDALDGEPGVKSSRYAGKERSFDKNIEKLLIKLEGTVERSAQFRTIISLIIKGKEHIFEGICKGTIIAERRGNNGFGYDSVFIPDGAKITFAEMNLDEKLRFSHREKAARKLSEFLKTSDTGNEKTLI